MSSLLLQGCSKSKKEIRIPTKAMDVYDGYYFKIIKKAISEGSFDNQIDICILSAKYGLLDPTDEITTYDYRMDQDRAEELNEDVVSKLEHEFNGQNYQQLIVNLGQPYQEAVSGIEDRINGEIVRLSGGLGERGAQLKQLIRDASMAPAEA